MNPFQRRINVLGYGVLAGLAISLGAVLYLCAVSFIPENGTLGPKIVGALLFPVGLMLVCFFKLNLYTGKIGVAFRNKKLDKKDLNVFEWLAWILLGNAIGAFGLGAIIYAFTRIDPAAAFPQAVINAGNARVTAFTGEAIFEMAVKSVLCGALVYIAIYFFGRLNTMFGKIVGIIVPISFFVLAGFQHCVANMFYIAAAGAWNWNSFFGLIVCIFGNSLGAILLDLFVKYE